MQAGFYVNLRVVMGKKSTLPRGNLDIIGAIAVRFVYLIQNQC